MADGLIQVPADDVGKKVDTSELVVGANTVERQRIVIGDNTGTATFALVTSASAAAGDAGLVVVPKTATVVLAAGTILDSISATVGVKGQVSLGPGTSNIGTINNVSATVTVAGTVSLGAGTANIGTINNISAAVALAAGVANIGTINNISATVTIAGVVNLSATAAVVLAAGTANFGTLNDISRTVQVAVGTPFTVNNISATVVTGLSYVIEKTTNSQVQVGDSANAAVRVNVVAGAAGGVSQVDGTSFNAQVSTFAPMGGIFDDVAPDTLSENDAGVVRMTTNRGMHVNLRTDGGVKLEDSANVALRVNIVAGGGTGGTSQIDGTSFNAQVSNFTPIGGIFDDVVPDTLSENDAGVVRMTTNRAFHVNLRTAAGVEISAGAPLSVKIENTSATASVVLAAGAANIGTLNDVSRTVQVAVATPFTVNNISATVTVAGVVGLTAGTALIGAVSLAAGTANIGFINNISATVTVVQAGRTPALTSVSHGPTMATASTSANVTLIAGPGAGQSIHVTMIAVTNGSGTLTKARVGTSASLNAVVMYMAASGGGFVMNFDPPWKLSASEAALCSVKPNVTDAIFNVHFYVAP